MFPCEQLFQCKKESLADFTNSSSPMNISELLTSAGYPHLSITEERQHPACECIFLYEVITKRIPSLNRDFKNRGRGGSETPPEVIFPISDEERMRVAFSPELENAA